jgi:hypothetical protein
VCLVFRPVRMTAYDLKIHEHERSWSSCGNVLFVSAERP